MRVCDRERKTHREKIDRLDTSGDRDRQRTVPPNLFYFKPNKRHILHKSSYVFITMFISFSISFSFTSLLILVIYLVY